MADTTTKKATSRATKATRAAKSSTKRASKATGAQRAGRAAKSTGRAAKSAARSTAKSAARAGTPSKSSRAQKRSSSRDQDAIAFLKSDHREVEDLFKKFEKLGSGAHKSREAAVEKMIEALAKHAAIEEEILYPEVRARAEREKDQDLILEALEEHHIVKWTLSELEKMDSTDERYTAKVTVLAESVRHHVKEEESELFKKARDLFTKSELLDMGERLKAAKEIAPSRPHPRAPDQPPGNIVANTLTAPLDVTAKVAGGAAKAVRRAVR